MAEKIYPCLWFDGQAKNAAEYYCSIFTGSKIVSENPMVVIFELFGNKIMALNGGPNFKLNASISMFFKTDSEAECDLIWNKLITDGAALIPYNQYPWAAKYGWLKDKYGLTWQIMLSEETSLMPSLLFSETNLGNAKPAIEFYSKIFENSAILKLNSYDQNTPFAGNINYSETSLNNYKIVAMDGPGAEYHRFNEAFSFVINCENQNEIDFYWDNLIINGGKESNCGWCCDKFGVWWQVIPAILGKLMANPNKSKAVMEAFLKMKKFDIAKLEAI